MVWQTDYLSTILLRVIILRIHGLIVILVFIMIYIRMAIRKLKVQHLLTRKNFGMQLSYMRLADIYLMYAEAVLQGYGSATSSYSGSITAEASFNKVRTRCGAGAVAQKFVSDPALFMNEIIRERAVELGFEDNHRYIDLRRWLVASNLKYREKTADDFDRGADGKPINMRERVIITRAFSDKDYWLPLKINDVTLYPSFGQNPGY